MAEIGQRHTDNIEVPSDQAVAHYIHVRRRERISEGYRPEDIVFSLSPQQANELAEHCSRAGSHSLNRAAHSGDEWLYLGCRILVRDDMSNTPLLIAGTASLMDEWSDLIHSGIGIATLGEGYRAKSEILDMLNSIQQEDLIREIIEKCLDRLDTIRSNKK